MHQRYRNEGVHVKVLRKSIRTCVFGHFSEGWEGGEVLDRQPMAVLAEEKSTI